MPRSKHPKKASEEVIETSKKLREKSPNTSEINPIEQIWKELRKIGFHNEVFSTLEKVVNRLCEAICSLSPERIFSITCRSWIIESFN